MRVPTKVSEFERSALRIRQLGEAFPDLLALEVDRDRLPGVGHFCGTLDAFELDLAVDPRIPAQPVDGAVSNDRKQPVSQAPARGVESSGVAPDREKRVLDGVFRGAAVVEDTKRQTVGEPAVPVIERFESRGVAALQLGRHVMVLVFWLPAHPRTTYIRSGATLGSLKGPSPRDAVEV